MPWWGLVLIVLASAGVGALAVYGYALYVFTRDGR